jgi:cytochrome c biogenesis protein CcmG/thiol:disulfide interchange protein DsbE
VRNGLMAACAALLLAGCGAEAVQRAPEVGALAPEYGALALAGDSASLEELRGEVVLLNVWATWCAPCREEIPALQQLHEKHADQGLRVVGVSVDTHGEEENVRQFAQSFGVTYPIWLDPEERVTSTFRTLGVPSSFLIDREGKIVWKHLGPVRADDPALTQRLQEAL